MKFSKPSYKAISSYIAWLYVLSLFVVYPFYMEQGYVGIDVSKYNYFVLSTLIGIVLMLVTGFQVLLDGFRDKSVRVFNLFLPAFAVFSILSYVFSSYKDTALTGTNGWFMGLETLLLICAASFLTARLITHPEMLLYPVLIASAAVFLLGLLDRFSLYIIPLEIRDPSFISTLGNINWFMGYYSVLVPIGAAAFLLADGNNKKKRYFLALYLLIAFMAGFAQGSESVFLFDIALLIGMIFLCYRKVLRLDDVLKVIMLWALSCQAVRLMRLVFPNGYNYETTGFCASMTESSATLLILAVTFIIYLFYIRFRTDELDKKIYPVLLGAFAFCFIVYIFIGVLRTNTDLLDGLSNSVFKFNDSFGSGRGAAYRISLEAIKHMSFKDILLGVGPDSYASFVYSIPELSDELGAIWPNDILTNSHSELLTMFINEGAFGLISYVGIFVVFIKDMLKNTDKNLCVCITLSAFCYLVHNLISFSQLLNTPFIFVLMAAATACVRNGANTDIL